MNQVPEIPEAERAGSCAHVTRPRHLLVLCHDIVDSHFDRRISQQAAVWAGRGWDVTIVGMTKSDGDQVERWPNGVMCIKIDQRRLLPVDDPLWTDLLGRRLDELDGWVPSNVEAAEVKEPADAEEINGTAPSAMAAKAGDVGSGENFEERDLASDNNPIDMILLTIRPFWKRLPLSWRRFGWDFRAKLNFRTRVARCVARCHWDWRRFRRFAANVQAWALRTMTRGCAKLLPSGLGVRTRLATILARSQVAVPVSLTPLLEWYPLPFTVSLLETSARLRPDVILACDLTTVPAALRLSDDTNAVLIYDSHEFYPEQISFTPRQRALLRAWDVRGLNAAFLAYTVSPTVARLMFESYGLLRMPQSLSNAPDFPTPSCQSELNGPLRRALDIESDSTVILYHGGFLRMRNLDILISGFVKSALPDTRLVLLGFGDMAWIDDLIRSVGGARVVHALDAVPASVLDRWVADANFVVIPYSALDLNTEYCSPNKLHDCVALGIPVLANQQLRDVTDLLSRFGIGLSLDMTSAETLATSLSALSTFQTDQANFIAARDAFGWATQQCKIGSWISMIEAELDGRTTVPVSGRASEVAIGVASR